MNEERALQTSTNKPEVDSIKGVGVSGEIIEKLEHTSNAYLQARKVPFNEEEMKVPFETDLPDAEFVQGEGSWIPEASLGLDSFGTLKQKRVGLSMSFSKKLMYDSGVNLEQYVKNLVTKRVSKAMEKSILAGSQPHEFKGIAHDVNVVSSGVSATTTEQLRELSLKVHEDYAVNSSFYMSRPFFEKVSKITDESGDFIVKHIMVNGKVVPTLFGKTIEVSNALDAGDTSGQVPVIFGSIEDCYTIGVSREYKVNTNSKDTTQALRGSVAVTGDFYGDGMVTNYQAVAKGVVS